MKVIVFEPDYNEKHCTVLRALAEGIPNCKVLKLREYEPCDVAIIFGLVKKSYSPTHAKKKVLDMHGGSSLIVVESAPMLRGQYWAVGFGGIGNKADFKNNGMESGRWLSMDIKTKPWHKRPEGPVVVCGQLPWDTNVQNSDHLGWCRTAIKFYQGMGLEVWFRPHPKIHSIDDYGISSNIHIDTGKLRKTLEVARCLVTYNSTSGVDGLLAGVPVIACHEWAFSWPIAYHCFTHPDKLIYPSRRQWLYNLAYVQWTLDEMKAGLTWQHLTR